jgi:hypothetical protein
MADINLKTLTPDTSLPTTGFLFGADSQATANPSVYGVTTAITAILGNAASSDVLAFNSDTIVLRDAANIFAQRNSTTAQAFRAYNTYTDGSNYERGVFDWKTTANTLLIGTQNAGTGTARNIGFLLGNALVAGIINDGISTGRIRMGGTILGAQNVILDPSGNGKLLLWNGSANGFDMLQFGGTNSSFPAIKRSSTTLQARIADDSAFASVQGKLTTDNAYTAGAVVQTGYVTIYDSTGTAYKILVGT